MITRHIAAIAGCIILICGSSSAQEETTETEMMSTPDSQRGIGVSIAGQPVERVAGMINTRYTSTTVVARGKTIGQTITLVTKEPDIEKILDQIVAQKPNWLWYKPTGKPNTYEIWDQESYRAEVLPTQVRQRILIPKNITAEEAYKAITGVLTPNIGSAAFDPRSNKLILNDLPHVIELAAKLLEQIDVKFITRVYYLDYAEPNKMAEHLGNLKSPAAPRLMVDKRTRQILVKDRLDILLQMDLIVETFDIPTPGKKEARKGKRARQGKQKATKPRDRQRALPPETKLGPRRQ